MELEFFAPLEPGTYFIDPDADPSTPLRVVYEVPVEGWSMWIGAAKFAEDGHVGVSITTVTNLVRHGCRDHSWADPPAGRLRRAVLVRSAACLRHVGPLRGPRLPERGQVRQRGSEVVDARSPPKDVTIYGYSGKHLELTVPDLPVEEEGRRPPLHRMHRRQPQELGRGHRRSRRRGRVHGYTGHGYRKEFWILDVEGTRLMIAAERSPGSPAEDLAELRAVLDSIRIEP